MFDENFVRLASGESSAYLALAAFTILTTFGVFVARERRISRELDRKLVAQGREIDLLRRAIETHSLVNVSDESGKMTYVNDTFTRVTGYERSELLGQTFRDVLVNSSPIEYPDILQCIQSGTAWTGNSKLRRKDGSMFWTRTTIVPSLDKSGTLTKTISLRTDITDTKARQAESQSRTLLDRLQDEVYVFGSQTLCLHYLNTKAIDALGWQGENYRNRTLADTSNDFDEPAFRRRIVPLVTGEVDAVTYESTMRGQPVEVSMQIEHGYAKEPRIVSVVRDILHRKQVEEARAQFVSTVSHELRSPLTSVMGALKIVTSGAFGLLPEKPAAMLAVAQRNVDRLLLLINDILDLEKLDAEKLDFPMEKTDLSELVTEAITTIDGYLYEYGVTVSVCGTDKPHVIDANRHRMMQVLTNLLSNAAKFSHRGGIVKVNIDTSEQKAHITVSDDGIGIPVDAQPMLFQRFVQAEDPRHRKRHGTGLGLSIAKTIVERHGGKIGFDSIPDIGTTFYIELPKVQEMRVAA